MIYPKAAFLKMGKLWFASYVEYLSHLGGSGDCGVQRQL